MKNQEAKKDPNFPLNEARKVAAEKRRTNRPAFFAAIPKEGKVVNGWRFFSNGDAVEEPDAKS